MTGIILQARMGSARLPGKIMKRIGDRSLLDWIFYRLSFLKHEAIVILATSTSAKDDVVEKYCLDKKINYYRGSESNVLERYYFCAKKFGLKHIVRLTADNPFVDIEEIDNLLDCYSKANADYANSFSSLPVGVGAEVFSFPALERSWLNGHEPQHLEHVNEYILENPGLFNIRKSEAPAEKNRPDLRLTVDTEEDYRKACFIAEHSGGEYITTEMAIELCSQFA